VSSDSAMSIVSSGVTLPASSTDMEVKIFRAGAELLQSVTEPATAFRTQSICSMARTSGASFFSSFLMIFLAASKPTMCLAWH